jgi:hypothetical protein
MSNLEESELRQALDKIEVEILDGLRHGYFELSVSCEIVKNEKRRLVIKSGKSHQFYILPGELDH